MTHPENERLATLETKMDNVGNDVVEIKDTLKTLVNDLDKRYAPKWVGDVVKVAAGAILLAFLTIAVLDPFKQNAANQTVTITTKNPDGSVSTQVVPAGKSPVYTNPSAPGTTTTTIENKTPSQPSEGSNQTPDSTQPSNQSGVSGIIDRVQNLF